MITGVTSSGFGYSIEDDAFDDYEMLEALREIEKGNTGMLVDVAKLLLGEEQKNALKEHIRRENGRVSASKMIEMVMEIFQKENKGKNF